MKNEESDKCGMRSHSSFFTLHSSFYQHAAAIQSNMQLQIPKSAIPAVQMARATLLLQSLLNVGSGLSHGLIYIAFTIKR